MENVLVSDRGNKKKQNPIQFHTKMKTNSAGKITSVYGLFRCRSPPFVRLWTLPSAETGRTGIHHMRDDAVHGWAFLLNILVDQICLMAECWECADSQQCGSVGTRPACSRSRSDDPLLQLCVKFPRPFWRCIIFPTTFSEIECCVFLFGPSSSRGSERGPVQPCCGLVVPWHSDVCASDGKGDVT